MKTIKSFIKNNPDTIETIGGFVLLGVLAYMFYFSLWVFCPCG